MSEALIVGGRPTAEELAALLTALAVMWKSADGPAPAPPGRHGWAVRHRALRTPLTAGPGAWRGSMWKLGGLR
ncbi:acyl-CoA carboxylase epsilon subunit [Planotetraspora sp. GP83]|uniref:acyl-CoA carboxylase epsilon subunit n=1 Tax=Planotetraspora sp. GP83 TaxID=3156264 RepID=UPI003511D58A